MVIYKALGPIVQLLNWHIALKCMCPISFKSQMGIYPNLLKYIIPIQQLIGENMYL